MTVRDLIRRLSEMDKDAVVSVRHTTNGEWGSFDARSLVSGVVKRKHGVMIKCKRQFVQTGAIG